MEKEKKEILQIFVDTREPKIFVHKIPEFISLYVYIAGFVTRLLDNISISDYIDCFDEELEAKFVKQINNAKYLEKKELNDYFILLKKVIFILNNSK